MDVTLFYKLLLNNLVVVFLSSLLAFIIYKTENEFNKSLPKVLSIYLLVFIIYSFITTTLIFS